MALNRAVAVGFAQGPAAGLAALDELAAEPQLAGYGYLAAARADFLRRLGRTAEAREAYTEALHLTANEVERAFLSAAWPSCSRWFTSCLATSGRTAVPGQGDGQRNASRPVSWLPRTSVCTSWVPS